METQHDVEHVRTDELPAADDAAGLIREAAEGRTPRREDDARMQSAADFLLGAFNAPKQITHTLRVNVGGVGGKAEFIEWTIKALPGELVRKIREDAEALVRRAGATGAGATSASFQAAVRYVIEASTNPDVKGLAKQQGIANPADFLEEALHNKQGLIEQISGQVLALSGYDNDDVQDALEVRASGNS